MRKIRRLTKAAFDLRKNEEKVIEIAFKYGWKYVMEVFFPEHGYKHAGTPDFELYSEGDMEMRNFGFLL